jgi:hypothetical protein
MKAQWWLIGVVSAIALGGTGCGQAPAPLHNQPARSDDHTAMTATSRVRVRIINGMGPAEPAMHITGEAKQHAVAAAIRMVKSAVLPPGSRDVARLPGKTLSEPAQVSACDPIVDATTLWLVRGSAESLTTFLAGHVPPGMRNDETGSSTSGGVTTSYSVADMPLGKHPPQRTLVFTFWPVSRARATRLRVDALTVPSGALCLSGGDGTAVPSPAHTANR